MGTFATGSRISHTTVDCHNAFELSEWWKPVLGYTDLVDHDSYWMTTSSIAASEPAIRRSAVRTAFFTGST